MTEESLGRAVAVVALQPIAERLAEQCEREEAEAEAAEHVRAEREARISSGLATSADLDEIARQASSEIATQDPAAIGRIWARLVASDAVGTPTHDVLEVHVKGKNRWLSLTELSRTPSWLASNAGLDPRQPHAEARQHQTDAWADRDGTVWVSSSPHPQDAGLISGLDRDMRGVVYGPRGHRDRPGVSRGAILMVLLPHGTSLCMKKLRKYPHGRVVEGVIIQSAHTLTGSFNPSCSLREAVVAILRARGFGPHALAP